MKANSWRPSNLSTALSSALLLALAGAALPTQAQPIQRRAGLWSSTVEGAPVVMRQCIGPDGDDLGAARSPDLAQHQCDRPSWTRESAERVVVTGRCTHAGSVATTRMVFTGRFDSAFDAEITVHEEPARAGQHDSTMRAKYRWLGACPAGVRPGQMLMPNGQVFDPAAMARHR
jgi:hypothetical protein